MDLSLKLCLLEIARPHLCLVNLKWVNNRALLKRSIAYVSVPVSTQYLSSTRYMSLLHPAARGKTSRNPNSFKKTGIPSAISQKRRPMTQVALVTNGLQFHQKVKLRLLVKISMPSLKGTNLPGGTACILPSAGPILSSVDPFLYQTYIGRPRKCKCAYCRRRKIKCEGGYPCEECTKWGHKDDCRPSTGDPPAVNTKRYKACDMCKRRKRKCKGGEPQCDLCRADRLECTWSQKRTRAKSQVANKGRRRAK